MSAYRSLSRAMVLGMLRDRMAVFFVLVFPLMFLVLFGALFRGDATSASTVVQVGDVEVFDEMPQERLTELADVLTVEKSGDREQALADVRAGDADAVIWQENDQIELRYSAADATRAGTVQALLQSVVQGASIAVTGQPAAYPLSPDQVEDESVQPIQYLAPGLLGWAVATGASAMSALTLVAWRKKRLLRRLWLAPITPGTVVGARVGVSLGLAFAQAVIFIAIACVPFYGLTLTGHWWLSVPLIASGTLAFMAIGLVVGALAKTEEAANGALQVIVLPMAFLSGAFFPADMMPGWVLTVSEVLPLKHLNQALQDVLSRGGGWGDAPRDRHPAAVRRHHDGDRGTALPLGQCLTLTSGAFFSPAY